MRTRLITAGVAVAVALLIIILGSLYTIIVSVALALVSAILCGEYLSAKKLNKDVKLFIPCMLFAFLIPLLSNTEARYIPLFLLFFSVCVISVFFHRTTDTNDAAFALAGVSLISVSLSALNLLVGADPKHAAFWIVFSLGVPWLADTGAYFAGSYLGKHKLCPDISPNKFLSLSLWCTIVS